MGRFSNMQLFRGVNLAMAGRIRAATNNDQPSHSRPRIAEDNVFVLGGVQNSMQVCISCFCDPCIADPAFRPSFIKGSSASNPGNIVKRYKLYKKTWSFLRRVGLWDFLPYKEKKEKMGHRDSPRDIIPWCMKQVCTSKHTHIAWHCCVEHFSQKHTS